MARQRFSLVPDEVKQELILESKIRNGEINPDNFHQLTPEEQKKVQEILFRIASDKVNPNIGASTLEFVVFAFMRIAYKQLKGLALTAEDQEIKESLERIMQMHQITNDNISKQDWYFDYMKYAEEKAQAILKNREEHIERKRQIMGYV
jgi:hypothetical protein